VRREDRRTLPDQQTNQPTDRPTDTASYRGALSPLKKEKTNNKNKELEINLQQPNLWQLSQTDEKKSKQNCYEITR